MRSACGATQTPTLSRRRRWLRSIGGNMEYVKLGQHRSRGLPAVPRLHDLRRARPGHAIAWTLDEEESRPFIRRRSNSGSISSTRRTPIPTARARRSSAARSRTSPGATRSSSPPRCSSRCARARTAGGLSRKAILAEIDNSLRRLGTDYVDLYQIHRWDYDTPIEETLEALHDVVKAGKARYIGASSMFAWQFCQGALRCRAARLDAVRRRCRTTSTSSTARRSAR